MLGPSLAQFVVLRVPVEEPKDSGETEEEESSDVEEEKSRGY